MQEKISDKEGLTMGQPTQDSKNQFLNLFFFLELNHPEKNTKSLLFWFLKLTFHNFVVH